MKFKKRNSDDDQYKNLKVGKLNFKDCFEEIFFFKKCLFKKGNKKLCQMEYNVKNHCLKEHFKKNIHVFLETGIFYNDRKHVVQNFEDVQNSFEIQYDKLPEFVFDLSDT